MLYRTATGLVDVELLALLAVGLAAALVAWASRPSRRAKVFLWGSLGLLAALHTPAVGYFALGSLEWPVAHRQRLPDDDTAMVVLSGGLMRTHPAHEQRTLAEDSLYRCLHAAYLYREQGPRTIVLSGGRVGWDEQAPTLAEAMRQFLLRQGIPDRQLVLEDRSTTTHENARFTAELLKARGVRRVILVTDAFHLPRAERCFRACGLEVVPAASRYRTADYRWTLWNCLPRAGASRGIQLALHEWLGLLWYKARGYL